VNHRDVGKLDLFVAPLMTWSGGNATVGVLIAFLPMLPMAGWKGQAAASHVAIDFLPLNRYGACISSLLKSKST
jgi:hypothetical protein